MEVEYPIINGVADTSCIYVNGSNGTPDLGQVYRSAGNSYAVGDTAAWHLFRWKQAICLIIIMEGENPTHPLGPIYE